MSEITTDVPTETTTDAPVEAPSPAEAQDQQAETVQVTAEEFARFQEIEAELAKAQADHQAKVEAMQAETAAIEQRTARMVAEHDYYAVDIALLDALDGVVFVNRDARGACREMLRGHVEARHEPDGSTKVVEKATGRPVADFVRDRLSNGSMSFFLAPKTRGGSGSEGSKFHAPQNHHIPGSFDDIAARFRNRGPEGLGLRPLN